jgi:alpha-amylase
MSTLFVALPCCPADSGQGHWPFPNDRVGQGYAYILTHPGVPCVFWEHYFEWGHELQQTIDTLLQVRGWEG